ncbi:hypothetical protein Tco_1492394 [Tanacetum coccineum]
MNTKVAKLPNLGTKIYSVTLLLESKFVPKVVEKNDLSKTVTSHLTTNKIIENCTKVLAPCLLKIKSEPINAYFKNNRDVHRDYLKVTNEHIGTLQELLEQARALKTLDENLVYACKFVEHIRELLVYVSASCPFTQSGNEKWAPTTSHKKNNKPYVDASSSKQIVVNDTKNHVRPSRRSKKNRSNTKNNRIKQPSRRSKKNKVEAQPRKSKSSSNKNIHISDCNANIKNVALSKNSENVCLSCNECLFSANHDACVVKYLKDVQKHKKAKYVKQKEKFEWKPTGRILKTICLKWIPTGRTVNLFIDTVRFDNDHFAAIMGYGDLQIRNITISRVYYVEGLGHNLFSVGKFCDSDLEVAFRKHTCFVRNLEDVDLPLGSCGFNLYTISMDEMMKSSPICLLSKALKIKILVVAPSIVSFELRHHKSAC